MDASQLRRLRWRCRRGMRELDNMLGKHVERLQAGSTADQQSAFDRLLDTEDDVLWDWLSGRVACPDPTLKQTVDDIRVRD